jgi:hypothetical protein
MTTMRFTQALLSLALSAATCGSANAVIVITPETIVAPGGVAGDPFNPVFTGGAPLNNDILAGVQPIATTGNLTQENSTGALALTNGSVLTAYGSGNASSSHAAYATAGAPESVTYGLSGIYNLDSIVVYGGWNDGGRDAQHYDILASIDGGVNYSLLITFDNSPGEAQGGVTTPVSHRVAFTENALPHLASGVTHLRFDFLATENGYTGYTEIDVVGSLANVLGDADGDQDVDLDDFYVISNNFYTAPSAIGLNGDVTADNFVDAADFRLWKSVAPAAVLAQYEALSAPEPSALVLGILALGAAACWQRT